MLSMSIYMLYFDGATAQTVLYNSFFLNLHVLMSCPENMNLPGRNSPIEFYYLLCEFSHVSFLLS